MRITNVAYCVHDVICELVHVVFVYSMMDDDQIMLIILILSSQRKMKGSEFCIPFMRASTAVASPHIWPVSD